MVVLLLVGGSAAALGAWYSERSSMSMPAEAPRDPVASEGDPSPRPAPIEASPPPEPAAEPERVADPVAEPEPVAAPEPIAEPVTEREPVVVVEPAPSRPRVRRPPRPPSGEQPGTVTGTPASPLGDRASTFDEIPWERR